MCLDLTLKIETTDRSARVDADALAIGRNVRSGQEPRTQSIGDRAIAILAPDGKVFACLSQHVA
jgi:hypothetical protein